MTKCKHGVNERDGITCAFCSPCRRHAWPIQATCPKCAGTDEYGPAKKYTIEDIKSHGEVYWHAQTKYWIGQCDERDAEIARLRKMQKTSGDS